MNFDAPNDVAAYLPHRPPMILLDGISDSGEEFVETYVTHSSPSLFADEHGNIPAWVGIEYMAQAVGVFAGIMSVKNGLPVSIGFLLGSRKYQAFTPAFKPHQRIQIRAERTYHSEDNIVQFQCVITDSSGELATADIKAIQPDSIDHIFHITDAP